MRPTRLTALLVMTSAVVAVLIAACGGGGGQEEGERTAVTPSSASGEVTLEIVAQNLLFDKDRLEVPAGSTVKVVFDNRDPGVQHNFAAYKTSEAKELLAGTALEAGPIVQELTFEAPVPGEYFFRCDVHPTAMNGTLVVK